MKHQMFVLASLLLSAACSWSDNSILPLDSGLTLAELITDEGSRTIAVVKDEGTRIIGIDINTVLGHRGGPVQSYQLLGYEGISAAIAKAPEASKMPYDYQRLASPAGRFGHHIALGFNYGRHADEVEQGRNPFIFLKISSPTRTGELPSHPDRMLDYEVEICARPLAERSAESLATSLDMPFGFYLCGDFTDRAKLMRSFDLDDMSGGRGFSVAKSSDGYFPTGPYLVIPKNTGDFLPQVELKLWWNEQLRQQASASDMIWNLDEAMTDIFLAQRQLRPTHTAESSLWLPDGTLNPDISILTGTPEGVIVRPPGLEFKIWSGLLYVLTGAFLTSDSVRDYTVERYVTSLLRSKQGVQPGDSIRMQATWMGQMDLKIVAP
jgi:2-keto-4-pentenoate hydratase/2-oxohepta-3-ene-1,7-dioic acid hydratase in catechol pathway